jgi:peroxiredoxin
MMTIPLKQKKVPLWQIIGLTIAWFGTGLAGKEGHSETALKEGDRIPEVTVHTGEREPFNLAEAVRGKTSLLVFYRGGWCPFCNTQLAELAKIESELGERGIEIFALSPDRPELVKQNQEKSEFNYRLLSDNEMNAAQAFGIAFQVEDELVRTYKENHGIDLEADSGRSHHLLPHPAVYLVDPDGIIRHAHVNPDYRDRLSAEELLKAVEALSQ